MYRGHIYAKAIRIYSVKNNRVRVEPGDVAQSPQRHICIMPSLQNSVESGAARNQTSGCTGPLSFRIVGFREYLLHGIIFFRG